MLGTPKAKGGLFLASSLCDGVEDNDIKQVTTLLLNKEADPNILIPSHGVTPFHLVIGNDSEAFAEEVTKLFLRHGGNPNVRSGDGMTPVHVAAAWGRVSVLELLLANGGDPLCLDDEGRNPFHYAFDGKYYSAITILGKYCEGSVVEDCRTNYRMAFDKLVINNGNVMAEYAPQCETYPESTNVTTDQETMPSTSFEEFSHTSGSVSPINYRPTYLPFRARHLDTKNSDAAKIHREAMEKEKCLVNAIINQLSNSLNSKLNCASEKHNDKSVSSESNTSQVISNENVNVNCERPRSRSKFKHYKCRILSQSNNTPGSPIVRNSAKKYSTKKYYEAEKLPSYGPEDSIVSRSPNFPSIEKDRRSCVTPKNSGVLKHRSNTKAFTPCFSKNDFREDLQLGREMARSTPRRRKTSCRSVKKRERNREFKENNTSQESVTSLSPEVEVRKTENRLICGKTRLPGRLAINLHESKYDEAENDFRSNFSNDSSCSDDYKSPLTTKNFNHRKEFGCRRSIPVDGVVKTTSRVESEKKSTEVNDRNVKRSPRTLNGVQDFKCNVKKNVDDSEIHRSLVRSQSFISVQEEYKYEDLDEGVALLERRFYVLPTCKSEDPCRHSTGSTESLPTSLNLRMDQPCLTDAALRKKLMELGDVPGPITSTTRQVYLKRLVKLESMTLQDTLLRHSRGSQNTPPASKIKTSLPYGDWVNHLDTYRVLENSIFREFSDPDPIKRWREGSGKTSFNYLLLDSRITKDLPCRAIHLSESEVWNAFVSSIFYVGKGKRVRPYAHLYDAFGAWVSKRETSGSKKIQRILNIWNEGAGVVCLHVFQNTMAVEAYTREAAMIDALGTESLGNLVAGQYYGVAATWEAMEKKKFGRYLLYKALHILLNEGERQLFPQHL